MLTDEEGPGEGFAVIGSGEDDCLVGGLLLNRLDESSAIVGESLFIHH